jgi:phosphatidylserine/phosphatidylglycerophosphate/cardiolipin synthase-like enzyme
MEELIVRRRVVFGLSLVLALQWGCRGNVPAPVEHVVDRLGLAPPATRLESDALSLPPARDGNRVQLLINGEASFAARLRLLKEAKRSIYVQTLIFKADTTGRTLADALVARKRAEPELDIRVIVDAYANIQDVSAQLMYTRMQNAGIEVEGFEAFYLHWLNEIDLADWLAGNKRYHEKYWIIDGATAVVGGMNIGDEYARCSKNPALLWRDQDVLVAGPVAADIEAAFLDNYNHFKTIKATKPRLLNPDAYWDLWRDRIPGGRKMLDHALALQRAVGDSLSDIGTWADCTGEPVESPQLDDVTVRFVRSRPRSGEQHIEQLYLDLIGSAAEKILIMNAYFVPHPALVDALVAAAKRGVQVQVINNSRATNDLPLVTVVGRLRYLALVEAGVEVYEWHAERFGQGTLHAKHAVFDERVTIIGSYNLDPRSLSLNSEDVVVIVDPRIGGELWRFGQEHDLPMAERVIKEMALAWADPTQLPRAVEPQPPWKDPRFDPKAIEYFLLRRVEGNF